MGNIHGIPGLFGGEEFYDDDGNQIGYSVPGIFGGRDFYDADGNHTGYSVDGLISGEAWGTASGTDSISKSQLDIRPAMWVDVPELVKALAEDAAAK